MNANVQVFVNGRYTVKFQYDELWLLIHHHDSEFGGLFNDENEARFCLNESKFSILSELRKLPKIDGKYEFLLEYPRDYPDQYNRWNQSYNPLYDEIEDYNSEQYAVGYEKIHIGLSGTTFSGLKHRKNSALLSGNCINNNWHYAIGAYDKQYINSFPGPLGDPLVSEVYLWVKILPSHSFLFPCNSCIKSYKFSIEFLYPLISIILFFKV